LEPEIQKEFNSISLFLNQKNLGNSEKPLPDGSHGDLQLGDGCPDIEQEQSGISRDCI